MGNWRLKCSSPADRADYGRVPAPLASQSGAGAGRWAGRQVGHFPSVGNPFRSRLRFACAISPYSLGITLRLAQARPSQAVKVPQAIHPRNQ